MGDQRRKPHVEARQFLFQLRPIWMSLYERSMMARLSLYDFNAPVRSPCPHLPVSELFMGQRQFAFALISTHGVLRHLKCFGRDGPGAAG